MFKDTVDDIANALNYKLTQQRISNADIKPQLANILGNSQRRFS